MTPAGHLDGPHRKATRSHHPGNIREKDEHEPRAERNDHEETERLQRVSGRRERRFPRHRPRRKKDAAEYVRGNGDVVAIKPADLQGIDLDALADTLKRAQWGQMEIDIITRALAACGLDR